MELNFTKAKMIFGGIIAFILTVTITLMLIIPQDVARFMPGNSHGNLANHGTVLRHNHDTFLAIDNSVYRLRSDNSLELLFAEEGAANLGNLQAVGNRLYFTYASLNSTGKNLTHFNLLTSQTGTVNMPEVEWRGVQVVGSWIYFLDENGISKIRESGTHLIQLIELDENAYISNFNVQNSGVYFTKASLSSTSEPLHSNLYVMNIDGTNIDRVIEDVGRFFIHGDFIYFTRALATEQNFIYVYNMRNSNITEVFGGSENISVSEFNIFKYYLVVSFADSESSNQIITIDLRDGHVQDEPINLQTPDNFIFTAIGSTANELFVWMSKNNGDERVERLYKFTDPSEEPVLIEEITR